jgi:hypothetical protein
VAEEGMTEAAPAVGGGADSFVAGVEEAGVEEAAEAVEGEIITIMAGENFFAFSKKAFCSKRVRPWEEPTFSQSTSAPGAYENAMSPSVPRFKERPFI